MLAKHGPGKGQTYHVLMSHLHWDHIMWFPFFTPSYIPGNTVRIYGCHTALEEAFRRQHGGPSFPVDFKQLGAKIEFVALATGRPYEIAGLEVSALKQHHGGDSYGYRIEHGGKVVVYSTDSEHKLENTAATNAFVTFLRDADLVIFDAMYSLADAISVKEDWGHARAVSPYSTARAFDPFAAARASDRLERRGRAAGRRPRHPPHRDDGRGSRLRASRRLEPDQLPDLALRLSLSQMPATGVIGGRGGTP